MKLWSPRELTKASRLPSGDQCGELLEPRALKSWRASPRGSASEAVQSCSPFEKTTCGPAGEGAGALPSPSTRVCPFVQLTAITSCFAPDVSLVGFGDSPARFFSPPRT